MNKKIHFIFLVGSLIIFVALMIIINPIKNEAGEGTKIKIVATLFPVYDIARAIGGTQTDVKLLLPPGVEAHSFDPKPGDMVEIRNSAIFVFTGKYMEPWVADVIKGLPDSKTVVVDASQNVPMVRDGVDPHIWLNFENAVIMVRNITEALDHVDPNHKEVYDKRAADYIANLGVFDADYSRGLAECKSKKIVYGGHYAFGYLAHRYGLTHVAAQGLAPDSEPTARDMTRLVDQIQKEKIKYVFYEELASPKVAETLAKETGTQMLLLNAGHNISRIQYEQGITFFDILKKNLVNLKIGLECK